MEKVKVPRSVTPQSLGIVMRLLAEEQFEHGSDSDAHTSLVFYDSSRPDLIISERLSFEVSFFHNIKGEPRPVKQDFHWNA